MSPCQSDIQGDIYQRVECTKMEEGEWGTAEMSIDFTSRLNWNWNCNEPGQERRPRHLTPVSERPKHDSDIWSQGVQTALVGWKEEGMR